MFNDGEFSIDFSAPFTSAFLMQQGCCVGGIDKQTSGDKRGMWQVSIQAPYNEETESDIEVIGYFVCGLDALRSLWSNRSRAYIG